jgi:hypothetical protein
VVGLAYPEGWVAGRLLLATAVEEVGVPSSAVVAGEKERARPTGLVELPIAVVVVDVGFEAGIVGDMGCQYTAPGLAVAGSLVEVADSLVEEVDAGPDSLAGEGVVGLGSRPLVVGGLKADHL